jgi:hypothetical protein
MYYQSQALNGTRAVSLRVTQTLDDSEGESERCGTILITAHVWGLGY